MIFHLVIFFLLLTALFFLSQKIHTHIYSSLYILTKNRNFSLGILVSLLLPGTIIHEVSHFILATILRVPTGELTVMPTIEKNGEVKAGKLFLGETDPFRLSVIGLAPMFVGVAIIYIIGDNFFGNFAILLNTKYFILNILGLYLLFVTSITMFSSKKDLQGVIIAGPIIFVLILTLYLVGVRVFLENNILQKAGVFLTDLNYYLVIAVVLDFLVFLILNVNLSFWQKLLKRKVN